MNIKNFKKFTLSLLIFLSILSPVSVTLAKIVGYVAKGNDGKYYEYDCKLLVNSYAKHLLSYDALLYLDYMKKKLYAFNDDLNHYVDCDDVINTYAKALVKKENFDVNQYTASKQAKKANMPSEVYVVTQDSSGKLKYTQKVLETAAEILTRINKAGNAADLEAVVTSRASQIGLSLTAFNKLNRPGKTAALNGVLKKRPSKGFDSLDKFKQAFNEAVTAVVPALDAALQAVNDASTRAGMKTALLDHEAILELGLGRYGLTANELDELASRLSQDQEPKLDQKFKLRPFASARELQQILHAQVIALRFGFTVNHTRYNYTLGWLLDKQMTVSPQIYEGGWKNAKKADVQRYLDPYNFIDMDYCGTAVESIRITADPNLIVRQRPTTQGTRVTDAAGNGLSVYKGEVYAILERAQAEKGTGAGTEGTWYRIAVSGTEGWVCGKYCQVLGKSLSVEPMFQFLRLSGSAGSTNDDLNKILKGKGILSGYGGVFRQAAEANDINEIFLVALALHETGNGTSRLAKGIEVEVGKNDKLDPELEGEFIKEAWINTAELYVRERPTTASKPLKDSSKKDIKVKKDDSFTILAEQDAEAGTSADSKGPWYKIAVSGQEGWICGVYVNVKTFVKVYNFFGIGAVDSNPERKGSEYAYDMRWFTPEKAIWGGAEFTSGRYINDPRYYQNTLYKMRWNPGNPATHQYATDIAWAANQVAKMEFGRFIGQIDCNPIFDIPRFKE